MTDRNESRKPQGRMICAWCGRVIGASGTDSDSHGICERCRDAMLSNAGIKREAR